MTEPTITLTMTETEALAVSAALEAYPHAVPTIVAHATSPIDVIGAIGVLPQVREVLDRIDTTMQAAGLVVPEFVQPLGEVPDTPEGL